MPKIEWQVLYVDDDPDFCRQVEGYLDGETIGDSDGVLKVQAISDFNSALIELESRRIDVLILDVRVGPYDEDTTEETKPEDESGLVEEGVRVLDAVRQRRFVPVVFYTGLDYKVRDLESPVVRVVEKTKGVEELLESVKEIFNSALPQTNRALVHHLENVQRDYMWGFVARQWNRFGSNADRTALAYLLAKRLAISLSGSGIQQLALDLGDDTGTFTEDEKVHPMLYYLIPPVESAPLAGDLYYGTINEKNGHWILITPSCDMVYGREKADHMLFARCSPLTGFPEFTAWEEGQPNPSTTVVRRLKSLLRNNRQDSQSERFYFLPGALTLPDLVADLQDLVTLPRASATSLERTASLDSPFAEAFIARFSRYFGRLGTPDLDVDSVVSRLADEVSDKALHENGG